MPMKIKMHAKRTYRKLRWLAQRLRYRAPSLRISTPHNHKLTRLGTEYGGWKFVDSAALKRSVVVSCGLGEDASFDVEFAAKYDAKVVIVDPTPRAIQHFNDMMARLGQGPQQPYRKTAAQPVEAYDLSSISNAQLRLCEKAIWNKNTYVRFFAPESRYHVSHSIVNYQHNYSTKTAHIEVEAVTIDDLLKQYDIGEPSLLKLDIEGAEIEVLMDMISKRIHPKQVLVEYDELAVPSKKSKERIEGAHAALLSAGYQLIAREHTNFSYILQSN